MKSIFSMFCTLCPLFYQIFYFTWTKSSRMNTSRLKKFLYTQCWTSSILWYCENIIHLWKVISSIDFIMSSRICQTSTHVDTRMWLFSFLHFTLLLLLPQLLSLNHVTPRQNRKVCFCMWLYIRQRIFFWGFWGVLLIFWNSCTSVTSHIKLVKGFYFVLLR